MGDGLQVFDCYANDAVMGVFGNLGLDAARTTFARPIAADTHFRIGLPPSDLGTTDLWTTRVYTVRADETVLVSFSAAIDPVLTNSGPRITSAMFWEAAKRGLDACGELEPFDAVLQGIEIDENAHGIPDAIEWSISGRSGKLDILFLCQRPEAVARYAALFEAPRIAVMPMSRIVAVRYVLCSELELERSANIVLAIVSTPGLPGGVIEIARFFERKLVAMGAIEIPDSRRSTYADALNQRVMAAALWAQNRSDVDAPLQLVLCGPAGLRDAVNSVAPNFPFQIGVREVADNPSVLVMKGALKYCAAGNDFWRSLQFYGAKGDGR